MINATDADLVERSRCGEEAAFIELIGRHRSSLKTFIKYLVDDYDHADDVMQETIIRSWQKLSDLRDIDRFKPWLFQIARNCCREYHRRSGRIELPMEDEVLEHRMNQCGRAAGFESMVEKVADAMDCLSHTERVAVELFYFQGLNIRELSETTHSSEGAVKMRLYSARHHMRSYLGVSKDKEADDE